MGFVGLVALERPGGVLGGCETFRFDGFGWCGGISGVLGLVGLVVLVELVGYWVWWDW